MTNNTQNNKKEKKTLRKLSIIIAIMGLISSLTGNIMQYVKAEKTVIIYQGKNDSLTGENKKLIEEIKKQQEEIKELKEKNKKTKINSDVPLLENEILNTGNLKIRILKNSEPIPFMDIYVSCAIDASKIKKSVLEYETEIDKNCETVYINCKLNNQRWLLDRYAAPKVLSNHELEVNGKIIPSKYHEDIDIGNQKSVNYVVLLRINENK